MTLAPPIGLLLLAAGGSARMGRPKQLLVYQGKSLLRRAAEVAAASPCRPAAVVLGCRADEMFGEIGALALHAVVNPRWQAGMGSSLRLGVAELLAREPELDALLVMTCDQPFVTGDLLRQLVEPRRRYASPLCAAAYGDTLGVPALFGRPFFQALQTLPDEEGARKILLAHRDQAVRIPFPRGTIDVDTPANYEDLINDE